MKNTAQIPSFVFLFLVFTLNTIFARAADESKDITSFAGQEKMNGYTLKQFAQFDKNWKLVTVRFRRDTNEMRFTYANPIAWKALQAGSKDYPDGAVFAKIGAKTGEDPAFVNSNVPSGAVRYQLMVKNKKKHPEQDGWGYALFDKDGLTFPEDPKVQIVSCHACHKLVPDRGFVFSQEMKISPFTKRHADGGTSRSAEDMLIAQRIKFVRLNRSDLPADLQQEIPSEFKSVDVVDGEIPKAVFQGTLNEMLPTLVAQTVKNSGLPAVLVSIDKKSFAAAYPEPAKSASECAKEAKPSVAIATLYSVKSMKDKVPPVRGITCHAR